MGAVQFDAFLVNDKHGDLSAILGGIEDLAKYTEKDTLSGTQMGLETEPGNDRGMGILDTDGSGECGINTQMIFISVFPGANEGLTCFWCCSRTMKLFLILHLSLCLSQTKERTSLAQKFCSQYLTYFTFTVISGAAVLSRNITINLRDTVLLEAQLPLL